MLSKKLFTGVITAAAIGMMLTGCDSGNPPEPGIGDGDPIPTESSSPAPGGQVTEDGRIARVEDAPGPGEPDESNKEARVFTTADYQRIKEWYGIDIISVENPYIQVNEEGYSPSVASLSKFNNDDNLETVKNYVSTSHSDWSIDENQIEETTYLYYENGILSGIYPALKYNADNNYILLDPVYGRIIDGSKQTLRAYLEKMVEDCTNGKTDKEYVIEFIEDDTICFAEGTSLKDALNVYCAYTDQGYCHTLRSMYAGDYLYSYVYGYTGDAVNASYYSSGFDGLDSSTSTFLNIYFNHDEKDKSYDDDPEGYSTLLFGEIDKTLAEADIHPFYDKYMKDLETWELNKDEYLSLGYEEPTMEQYEKRLKDRKEKIDGVNVVQYGQRFLSVRRINIH